MVAREKKENKGIKMSYKSFKNISNVCEKFKLDYKELNFIKEKKITINNYCIDRLMEFYGKGSSFTSETATSERITFPILYEVARIYDLPVWSQQKFNVDKSLNLTGTPDFIIAPAQIAERDFKLPVVCLGEAKKNDFEKGWGQVGAEMVAAQIANNNREIPVFGLVTDGKNWEFGKLENYIFTMNKSKIVAPDNLKEVFNTLNWLFCEARKNADQLLMLND